METTRFSIRQQTLPDAIRAAIRLPSVTPFQKCTSEHFVEATRRAKAVAEELSYLCHGARHPPLYSLPPLPVRLANPLELRIEVMRRVIDDFAERLAGQLQDDRIGRVEWYSRRDCCVIHFENDKWSTVLRRCERVVQNERDLVGAQLHALPAHGIRKPRAVRDAIRKLNLLYPFVRILTGKVAGDRGRLLHWSAKDTLFGHLLRRVAKSLRRRMSVTASPAVRDQTPSAQPSRSAIEASPTFVRPSTSSAVESEDPALVLGDRVFFVWE